MLITPHLLVGAAIGAKIKHFGWIIVFGLISHFVLDKVPHWVYGHKILKKLFRAKPSKILVFFLQIIADGLIGLIIVALVLLVRQKEIITSNYLLFVLTGILASTFPDFAQGVIKLFGLESKKLFKIYIHFHEKICHPRNRHIKHPDLLGLGGQILVSIIGILILLL